MNWTILARKLAARGLPALAAALAGPAGGAAGAQVAKLLRVNPDPAEVTRALAVNPDATVVALRSLELEFAAKELANERTAETTSQAVQEANIREARLQPDLNAARLCLLIGMLVVLLLSITGLTVAWLMVEAFPPELFGLIGTVVGLLVSKVGSGWDYFFGTSSGSAAKERTAAIERMVAEEKRL